MERLLLIRYSEIHLKGLNRPFFERLLLRRLNEALTGLGCTIAKGDGRFYITGFDEGRIDEAAGRAARVFGVHSVCRAAATDKDMDSIYACAKEMAAEYLKRHDAHTFKAETKRADKRFPLRSMDVSREVGAYILRELPELTVNVTSPDMTIHIEIRERAYVYIDIDMGPGGMPVGSNGSAMLLLSGGIDSPVAGYMIAKRGVALHAIHYHSFPFTGEQARQKVVDLAHMLAGYAGTLNLHVIHFTDIQQEIYQKCPHAELTIIMRRYMMDIAQRIAQKEGCQALITGESVGQVASQTIESLVCTDAVVTKMPVFRPLIGMDKSEIIDVAHKIGTYETSILPFEDCCTVFVAKHPTTKPRLANIERSEAVLDREGLITEALSKSEVIRIEPR